MTTSDPDGTRPRPQRPLRSFAAYSAVAVGAILMLMGWYGASGETEVARQIPFLASGSLPGLALVAGGVAFAVGDRSRRSNDQASAMVASLYHLLTEAAGPEATADAATGESAEIPTLAERSRLVAVPEGSRYHRAECALVDAKPVLDPVDAAVIEARGLSPCPICEPAAPTA